MIEEPTLIFIHIPKTAGRTMESVLERQYNPESIYNIYGYGAAIPEAVRKLENLHDSRKREIKLVKGHYQFGLHRLLPQECVYITLLRDPIERAISHYTYIKTHPQHPLNSIVESRNMPLGDYVTSGISIEMDNGQTRLVSGREEDYLFGECPLELLELAKDNIRDHFMVPGQVERFDECLALMSLELGWDQIHYARRNISQKRPGKDEIPKETLFTIERHNELDLALYEYAGQQIDELTGQWGARLDKRLGRLKWQNRSAHLQQFPARSMKSALKLGRKLRASIKG